MNALKRIFSFKKQQLTTDECVEHEFGEGAVDSNSSQQPSRRKFLLKCGKYTAYTAPVVYTLLAPKGSIYAQSGSGT